MARDDTTPRTPTSFEQQVARTRFRFRGFLAPAAEGVRAPLDRRLARQQLVALRAGRPWPSA